MSSGLAIYRSSLSSDMTMASRIRAALSEREMTPADLIRMKVLSKAGVYFLLDGTTKADKVRAETVSRLCKALSVNRDWLLHGRGPMAVPSASESASQTPQLDVDTVMAVADMARAALRESRQDPRLELNLTDPGHAATFVAGYLLAVEASQLKTHSPAELALSIRRQVNVQGTDQDERGEQTGHHRAPRRAGSGKAR